MFDDVLAVVEEEQPPAVGEGGDDGLDRLDSRVVARAHGGGHRAVHRRTGPQGREIGQPDLVVLDLAELGRHFEGEPGLPGASRCDQGDEPVGPDAAMHLRQFGAAPDEAGAGAGQPGFGGDGMRLLHRIAVGLVEALRLVEVAQSEPTEELQGRAVDLFGDRLGQQHLAALGSHHDPGGLVNGERDVVIVAGHRLTGVQADPDRHLGVARPALLGECGLGLLGGGQGGRGAAEGDQQPVAESLDDPSPVRFGGVAQQLVVRLDQLDVLRAEVAMQHCRPHHVREHERDEPARQRPHPAQCAEGRRRAHVGRDPPATATIKTYLSARAQRPFVRAEGLRSRPSADQLAHRAYAAGEACLPAVHSPSSSGVPRMSVVPRTVLATFAAAALSVVIALPATARPPSGGGTGGVTGNDISWPQCGKTLPTGQAFGIVA